MDPRTNPRTTGCKVRIHPGSVSSPTSTFWRGGRRYIDQLLSILFVIDVKNDGRHISEPFGNDGLDYRPPGGLI